MGPSGTASPSTSVPSAIEPVAGVDADHLAGDRLGEVGGEEHDRAGDLLGVRQVAEAGLGRDLVVDLLERDAPLLGLVVEVPLDRVALDVAGVDGVDPDAVRAELERPASWSPSQRALRRRVGAHFGSIRWIDIVLIMIDPAVALRLEVRDGGPGHVRACRTG